MAGIVVALVVAAGHVQEASVLYQHQAVVDLTVVGFCCQ